MSDIFRDRGSLSRHFGGVIQRFYPQHQHLKKRKYASYNRFSKILVFLGERDILFCFGDNLAIGQRTDVEIFSGDFIITPSITA